MSFPLPFFIQIHFNFQQIQAEQLTEAGNFNNMSIYDID